MNNYERGFITKCAEHGVDPETLVKVAGIGGFLGKVLGKSKALPKHVDYDVVRAAAKKSHMATAAKNARMTAVLDKIQQTQPKLRDVYIRGNRLITRPEPGKIRVQDLSKAYAALGAENILAKLRSLHR